MWGRGRRNNSNSVNASSIGGGRRRAAGSVAVSSGGSGSGGSGGDSGVSNSDNNNSTATGTGNPQNVGGVGVGAVNGNVNHNNNVLNNNNSVGGVGVVLSRGGGVGVGGGGFRRGGNNNHNDHDGFHPRLITAQIITIQCFHYFLLAFLFQINNVLFGQTISIDRIFTDKYIRVWTNDGIPDATAIIFASIIGAVILAIVIEKSKKCLDFSVTLFIVHLIICTFYSHFPIQLDWWVIHILGTIIMVLGGEYLCSRKELDDIPLLEI